MGRKKFDSDGYADWLERIPQESRMIMAKIFAEQEVEDYDGVIKFSKLVMVQVLAGNIPPVAAEAASKWAEIMLTSLAARQAATAGRGEAYSDLVGMLTAVEEDTLEASYTTFEGEYDEAVNS